MIEIIKNESIDFWIRDEVARVLSKQISIDPSILRDINITKYNFKIFIRAISIDALFVAYNKGYIGLEVLLWSALYNSLPLYITKDKLATVFQNKEIKTTQNIDVQKFKQIQKSILKNILA